MSEVHHRKLKILAAKRGMLLADVIDEVIEAGLHDDLGEAVKTTEKSLGALKEKEAAR